MAANDLWMAGAMPEKTAGDLHEALGIPQDEKIGCDRLRSEMAKRKARSKVIGGRKKMPAKDLKVYRMCLAAYNANCQVK